MSSKRNSFKHHRGSFTEYIGTKRRKLNNQLIDQYQNKKMKQTSKIFHQTIIWINGRTQPPCSTLMEIILNNGGMCTMTYTSTTTHIIADNIPISKMKKYLKNRNTSRTPILKPQWILDSLQMKKLQNINDYQLLSTSNDLLFKRNEKKNDERNERNERKNDIFIADDENQRYLKMFGKMSTLTNPNFVQDFYSKSRLHLLGTFKLYYQQIFKELQKKKSKYDSISFSTKSYFHSLIKILIQIIIDKKIQ